MVDYEEYDISSEYGQCSLPTTIHCFSPSLSCSVNKKCLTMFSLVSSTEDATETDTPQPRERSNTVLFVLCGLVVTFGAVGVWKMRLKKGKSLLGHTEIEQDRGTRHKMDSTSTTTPNISGGSVMHRKLKSSV